MCVAVLLWMYTLCLNLLLVSGHVGLWAESGNGWGFSAFGAAKQKALKVMSPRHLASVALSLCLGAVLFLYWRESSQLQDSRLSNRQLERALTSSRSERDQVQFRLNLLREDVETAQQAREESERRVQELDEQLQEERGKLVSRDCACALKLSWPARACPKTG